MRILDLFPTKGCFAPGEKVTLILEIHSEQASEVGVRAQFKHLMDEPRVIEESRYLAPGIQKTCLEWIAPTDPAGYAVWVDLIDADGLTISGGPTSFDVLARWTDFPRYGFLSDFGPDRADPHVTLASLACFHVNGLQFYDWQYRHDRLLSPTEEYLDPLGRQMSLDMIRRLVDSAHRYGMAALPYLAIYAASAEFWREHPEWALYDEDHHPIPFGENFIGLMNPAADSLWTEHLLTECRQTLRAILFDGLHIDQYGDPKTAWDSRHQPVDLPRAFVDFIQIARGQHPHQAILFNAVGNWPIEALSAAPLDFLYIEIWPPDITYRDLARIVMEGVHLSGGKPVVIALYLPADHPENVLLADALILACGGTRIELGEGARLLSDPYFPKHQQIEPDLYSSLRRFYDFAVRDGEWLRPYALSESDRARWAVADEDSVSAPDSILPVMRPLAEAVVIQFVNFTGLGIDARWDASHAAPEPCSLVPVRVRTSARPERVFWDCPEFSQGAQTLDFDYSNGEVRFVLPHLNFAALVCITR